MFGKNVLHQPDLAFCLFDPTKFHEYPGLNSKVTFFFLHVFPIPIPSPTFLSAWSLWVFPVHQARALVSCIPPGLVICFTLDNIHVSMLFSWNIAPLPSPRVQKSVLYICVSFSVLHIGLSFFNRILIFIFSPAASYTLCLYIQFSF